MATQGLKLIVPGLAALALALFASGASAQDPAPVMFKDLDDDGVFSPAEIDAALADQPAEMQRYLRRAMTVMDADHDGQVSPVEFVAMNGKRPPIITGPAHFATTSPFAKIDIDNSGLADPVEQALLQAQLPRFMTSAWLRAVKAADADGDGNLSADEWATLRP